METARGLNKAPMMQGCGGLGGNTYSFSMADRINNAIAEAEQKLDAARRAQVILQQHPEIEELLNLLQRF